MLSASPREWLTRCLLSVSPREDEVTCRAGLDMTEKYLQAVQRSLPSYNFYKLTPYPWRRIDSRCQSLGICFGAPGPASQPNPGRTATPLLLSPGAGCLQCRTRETVFRRPKLREPHWSNSHTGWASQIGP